MKVVWIREERYVPSIGVIVTPNKIIDINQDLAESLIKQGDAIKHIEKPIKPIKEEEV